LGHGEDEIFTIYFNIIDKTGHGKFCERYLDNKIAPIELSNLQEGTTSSFEYCIQEEDSSISKVYTTYESVKNSLNLNVPIEEFLQGKSAVINMSDFQTSFCNYYRDKLKYENTDIAGLKMSLNY